jgi:hypothetical protein
MILAGLVKLPQNLPMNTPSPAVQEAEILKVQVFFYVTG